MSLIRLRELMRRQARRAAVVLIVVALGSVVAAHHAGLHEAHSDGGAIAGHAVVHGDHAPAIPPAELDEAAAVCLAVLPVLLLLLAAGLGSAIRLPRWRLTPLIAPPRFHSRLLVFVDRRARVGPSLLCVMRC